MLARQIALALIAGNKVVTPRTDETAPLLDMLKDTLKDAAIPEDRLEDCSPEHAEALRDGDIAGIAIDGEDREAIGAHLCRREGAILPLLSAFDACLLYTSPSPRDQRGSRMPSSA